MRLRLIQLLSPAIMIAAALTSYRAQHELFLSWQVDSLTAVVAPLSMDMLALLCSLALHVPSLPRLTKATAVLVLLVAGGASVAANWLSGATVGAKAVHASMVLWYLLSETIASQVTDAVSKVKAMTARQGDEETKAAAQSAEIEVRALDAMAEDLPAAPVSPAPVSAEGNMAGSPAGPRRGRPERATVAGPEGRHVDAKTGEPLPERTERRARTGK